MEHNLCELLKIDTPIIQGGMVWCSGWKLASAVSNEGALGVLGSGSMYPDVLEEHLIKLKKHCAKSFAVNLPLLYPQIPDHIDLILKHQVPIVITSAGNPAKYTALFKKAGIVVLHVVASVKFAQKAMDSGVDALIVEGKEAGGHNGKEELETQTLLQMVKEMSTVPVVAAGGVANGADMYRLMAMGADGVQVGSRFAIAHESSAHPNFKQAVVDAKLGDTALTLKQLAPVRMLKNKFYHRIEAAIQSGASVEELKAILGKGRAKKGIFEGDLEEGELEIGEVAGVINEVLSVKEILEQFKIDFEKAAFEMQDLPWQNEAEK